MLVEKYDFRNIEEKWQNRWASEPSLLEENIRQDKRKFYNLVMFPYPSGGGLHMGHARTYCIGDVMARFKRMRGLNVLHPMGWDAFGMPAENAAIERNLHPADWTYDAINTMEKQQKMLAISYNWDRRFASSDPEYYRWTQWLFLELLEKGLAYRKMAPVNWCPHCQTVLANEQVEEGGCWRCHTLVEKKDLEQWFFRITRYADRLLADLDLLKNWPERVKAMQRNWIGKSEGADVQFSISRGEEKDGLTVFTTRPDTIWGATFIVLAPEHPLVEKLVSAERLAEIRAYVSETRRQSDVERESTESEKTGAFLGAYAMNPANGERIPIWVANYVLMTYGTGAIMAVPAHDERDFAFAVKYGIPIIPVIKRPDGISKSYIISGSTKEGFDQKLYSQGLELKKVQGGLLVTLKSDSEVELFIHIAQEHLLPDYWCDVIGSQWHFIFSDATLKLDSIEHEAEILRRCQTLHPPTKKYRTVMEMLQSNKYYRDLLSHNDYGAMIHSGELTGTPAANAREAATAWLEKKRVGKKAIHYRLRDWLISRQRYWGTPIPVVYCDHCGIVPVRKNDLPVLLPENPPLTGEGGSPLARMQEFVETSCPYCGGPARRETDTMDTFVDSSWYYLRYTSPDSLRNPSDRPFDSERANYWLPVDLYIGGIEHAILHLLYSRFFTKVLYDQVLVNFEEPFRRLFAHGMVTLGGTVMSKSRGNVVSPDETVRQFGADSVRMYSLFISPPEMDAEWTDRGLEGIFRFLNKFWRTSLEFLQEQNGRGSRNQGPEGDSLLLKLHDTIRRVSQDIEERFRLNTAVSALMELVNEWMAYRANVPLARRDNELEQSVLESLCLLLAPFAPHIASEVWERTGKKQDVHQMPWPTYDRSILQKEKAILVIQVNGKLRDRLEVRKGLSREETEKLVLANPQIQKYLVSKTVLRVIIVPDKIANIVVK